MVPHRRCPGVLKVPLGRDRERRPPGDGGAPDASQGSISQAGGDPGRVCRYVLLPASVRRFVPCGNGTVVTEKENAVDAPGVRPALARERRKAWGMFIAGFLLFSAFAAGAMLVADRADRAEQLERDGTRVEGHVRGYSPGTSLISEHVDVQFRFAGTRRTERVQLDDQSPAYQEGQSVAVLVDPLDPRRVTIAGETNQSQWTVWLMIGALLAGLYGLVAGPWVLARTRRQRHVLASSAWRTVPLTYREVPSVNVVRALLRLQERGEEHIVTLVSTARWNLARTGLRAASQADLVGDPSQYVVLRTSDTTRVVSARPPRNARTLRRWRDQLTDGT